MPSILLLFLGDPSTDRRVQSFERFFREQGWTVELMATLPSASTGPRRFLSYDRRAKRAVRTKQADVVMACDLYSLGAAVRMKQRGNAKRVIYDAREVYTELPTVAHRPIVKWSWRRYERRYIDHVDVMLVTAPHDADAIRRVHQDIPRTVLVRNLPWLSECTKDRSRLVQFGLAAEDSRPTIVYVGGLQKGRGLPQLVRSMRSVAAHLLLIGSGVLEEELRQLIKREGLQGQVTMTGPLASEDALSVVAACDAGVSLIEPVSESYELALPSKIFEYMMAGIPVLSSRLIHVEELFAREPWIKFVDVTRPSEVESGLRELLTMVGQPEFASRESELAHTQYNFAADAKGLRDVLHVTFGL